MSARSLAATPALLDTCMVSELMRPAPDPRVMEWLAGQAPDVLYLSAVSLAELWQGIEALPLGRRRSGLASSLHALLEQGLVNRVMPFGAAEAITLGRLMQERRLQGRPISFADAQIAATARQCGTALVTRNVRDFEGCGIRVVNPWLASRQH